MTGKCFEIAVNINREIIDGFKRGSYKNFVYQQKVLLSELIII